MIVKLCVFHNCCAITNINEGMYLKKVYYLHVREFSYNDFIDCVYKYKPSRVILIPCFNF